MTRLRCSLPAWLALAAMLVIFLAPVLSQTLALTHERESSNVSSRSHDSASAMHAGHVMAMQNAHDTFKTIAGHHQQTHPAGHIDLAQCGYCSLLAHTPLILEPALMLPPGRAGPHDAPVMARLQGHARTPWFPNAQSRAPPRFV
ncbi:DUF2946 domain-containing protein [Kushneria marisflavi]|uniref:Uncharacterized protein n=1 Tax=Kushneria marisflavi TaxID=157779 RepID=A0A240UMK8_9GAMM|nr:DUF2946 domain-containing protein [Kushneria marisflavi]ART62724.1 hypothetical protein B9H00_06395 [Kushneria marisflavi]RKD83871.1 hypothetical protein C8D96_2725 [Kushneria marisflavi]